MNPNISLVTEVVAVAEVSATDGVTTEDGAVITVGACHPKGNLEWLRLQVSPCNCKRNDETYLMDCR